MSFTTCSAGALAGTDFCLIFAPSKGYDEPEILPSSTHPVCLTIADAGQPTFAFWTATAVNLSVFMFLSIPHI
ncbi:MAG TPA: hypothetical protein VH184_05175, partial [Dongiaceae bacterium]|nr:hypothetical protein [Dongiaceae bacterium]